MKAAAELAKLYHGNQKRKYNGTPYWLHLARVAGLVSCYTDREEVLAAAWLHDVLEDTNLEYYELVEKTNQHTALIVKTLTKPDVNPRSERNNIYYDNLKFAQECFGDRVAPSTLIKLADRYDNLREMPKKMSYYYKETEELLNVLNVEHELVGLIRAWID